MNSITQYAKREFYCAVLLGTVPCALTTYFYGFQETLKALIASNPSTAVFLWSIFLLLLPKGIRSLRMRYIDNNLTHPGFLTQFLEVANEASTSLLGIYRTAAGFAMIFLIPVVVKEQSMQSFGMACYMILFSAGCLVMCCVLSGWKK